MLDLKKCHWTFQLWIKGLFKSRFCRLFIPRLTTHTPSAFYETFEPEEAWRLVERFEFHFTPKHGSWLNMAEIELSALVRQCLDQRIPDIQTLAQEVQAWQEQRNDEVVKVLWQFRTTDARTKLKHLYPKISGVTDH